MKAKSNRSTSAPTRTCTRTPSPVSMKILSALLAIPVWTIPVWATPVMAGLPQPATPKQIANDIANAGDAKTYEGADVVYVLDEADVYVRDSGLATTESCQVIKILTDAGVRAQSVRRFGFDPATRRVTVKSIRIHRAEGGIDDVPLNGLITQPTAQGIIFWGGEQHVIAIPDLHVGDTLEIRVSKIGFNIAYLAYLNESANGGGGGATQAGNEETLQPPMPGHWYEVTLFQGSNPILRKRYSVHMPKNKPLQFEVYNSPLKTSLWTTDAYNIYTFSAKDIPAIKHEPHQIALDDCVAKVVMATVEDWETKSRWFHAVNETQFKANNAIRKKVTQLTEGLTTLEDKIAACNHWVADNVRYYGTSRGACEGFTLHRSIETFRDRGGVCKDKAGMLITMLRVLGVEAYPALTMAGSRVEDIPADQFNHTVTVMRDEGGEFRVLDPTWIPLSREMWSSREALQGLVYGTAKGETLTLSPYYAPEYNRLASRADSRLDDDGTLHTTIQMNMQGYPDTYLRRKIHSVRKPEVRAAFEEALEIAPNAQLTQLDYTAPYDYSQNGQVRLEISASNYVAGGEHVRLFKLPLLSHPLKNWLIPDLFYPVDAEKREYGYRFRATRSLHENEHIALPPGWRVEKLPDPIDFDSPSASIKFSATADDGGLTYALAFELKKHTVPPEDYPKLKEAFDKMHDLSKQWIVCRQTHDAASTARADASTHHAKNMAENKGKNKEVLCD